MTITLSSMCGNCCVDLKDTIIKPIAISIRQTLRQCGGIGKSQLQTQSRQMFQPTKIKCSLDLRSEALQIIPFLLMPTPQCIRIQQPSVELLKILSPDEQLTLGGACIILFLWQWSVPLAVRTSLETSILFLQFCKSGLVQEILKVCFLLTMQDILLVVRMIERHYTLFEFQLCLQHNHLLPGESGQ